MALGNKDDSRDARRPIAVSLAVPVTILEDVDGWKQFAWGKVFWGRIGWSRGWNDELSLLRRRPKEILLHVRSGFRWDRILLVDRFDSSVVEDSIQGILHGEDRFIFEIDVVYGVTLRVA